MIAFLQGNILQIGLRSAVILVGGVGYKAQLSGSDLSRLKIGDQVSLHVHTHVREDALELFGFLDEDAMRLFEQLISVNGIGPKLALGILSGMEPKRLRGAVLSGDHATLTHIPGIGKKTAERLVLELKDKIGRLDADVAILHHGKLNPADDLRSALTNLGYRPNAVEKAVKSVEALLAEGKPLEALLKEALRQAV